MPRPVLTELDRRAFLASGAAASLTGAQAAETIKLPEYTSTSRS